MRSGGESHLLPQGMQSSNLGNLDAGPHGCPCLGEPNRAVSKAINEAGYEYTTDLDESGVPRDAWADVEPEALADVAKLQPSNQTLGSQELPNLLIRPRLLGTNQTGQYGIIKGLRGRVKGVAHLI